VNQYQKFCFLGVFSLGAMSFHEVAQAQYFGSSFTPQFITPYHGKPEQIRPDLYGPNGSDPAPRFRSSNSPRRSFDKAACDAAMEKQFQGVDMGNMLSDPITFGKRLELIMSSTPACHK
jgi:hypothetical protein